MRSFLMILSVLAMLAALGGCEKTIKEVRAADRDAVALQ